MKLTIPAGESREIFGQGEYFWIASASGALVAEVTAADGKRSTHNVNARFQLRVPAGVRSVRLTNRLTTDNLVEADTGVGQYIPSNDGQKVTLTGQDLTIEIEGKAGGQPVLVEGGLTDAELRATPVPVSGGLTDAELRATAVPVSGGLTDAELRATPVPVSGGLTDAELRAVPVDVQAVVYDTLTPGVSLVGSGVIPANADRKFLFLKALSTNTGIGWLSGVAGTGDALEAGERVMIETTAAVTITATAGTDQFAFSQIEV